MDNSWVRKHNVWLLALLLLLLFCSAVAVVVAVVVAAVVAVVVAVVLVDCCFAVSLLLFCNLIVLQRSCYSCS